MCYTFSWGNKEKFTQWGINYESYNNAPYRGYITWTIFYEGRRNTPTTYIPVLVPAASPAIIIIIIVFNCMTFDMHMQIKAAPLNLHIKSFVF